MLVVVGSHSLHDSADELGIGLGLSDHDQGGRAVHEGQVLLLVGVVLRLGQDAVGVLHLGEVLGDEAEGHGGEQSAALGEHVEHGVVQSLLGDVVGVLTHDEVVELLVDTGHLLVGVGQLGDAVHDGDEHTAGTVVHSVGSGHLPAGEAVAVVLVVQLAVTVEVEGHVLAVCGQDVQGKAAVTGGGVQLVHGLAQLHHHVLVEDHAGGDTHGGVGEDVTGHDVGLAIDGQVVVATLIPPGTREIHGGDLVHVHQVVVQSQAGVGVLVADEHIVVIQTAGDLLLSGLVDAAVRVTLVVEHELDVVVLGNHGVTLVEGVAQDVALHALDYEIVYAVVAGHNHEVTVVLLLLQLLVGRLGGRLVGGAGLSAAVGGGTVTCIAAGDDGEKQAHSHQQGESQREKTLEIAHS